MKRKSMIFGMIIISVMTMLFGACTAQVADQGTMQVYITDAPPEGVTAIEIKASNIEAHLAVAADDRWVSLLKDPPVFDLVKAIGVNVLLGGANITVGRYTQVRLDITEVTVTLDGKQVKAAVPGDKLKLVGEITIEAGKDTPISLDFDAEKSIVLKGNGEVSLKPVVKLLIAKPGEKLEKPVAETTTATPPPVETKEARAGIVQMWVTDAPRTDNITGIWVTVSDIKIHEAAVTQGSDNGSAETEGEIDDSTDNGGWISVNMTGTDRFDLLALRGESGGLQQILAAANLTEGRYTQIRLTVDKVEVNIDGVLKDAVLPSGKLKFVHPFDVEADSVTKLLFDFDADKFINVSGSPKEPKIMAKPVVKLIVSKPKPAPVTEAGIKITTRSLPNGTVGVSYNATLEAISGTLPYNWSVNGALPAGLEIISATGVISGTPTGEGDYKFTAQVSDNATPANHDTQQFKIIIENS